MQRKNTKTLTEEQRLLRAIRADDMDAVKVCLAVGVRIDETISAKSAVAVNLPDVLSYTPFALACRLNRAKMVELFLELKPNLNHQHPVTGYTILHEAVLWQHVNVCARLLQAGADINVKSYTGTTPYDLALSGRRNVALIRLFKKVRSLPSLAPQELVWPRTGEGLERAISTIKLCIAQKAKLPNYFYEDILCRAFQFDNVPMIEYVLTLPIDIKRVVRMLRGRKLSIEMIQHSEAGRLIYEAHELATMTVNKFARLTSDAEMNLAKKYHQLHPGTTDDQKAFYIQALCRSIDLKNERMVDFLLSNYVGIDLNAIDKTANIELPLIHAVKSGSTAIAARLIKAGANVNGAGHDSYIALAIAVRMQNKEMVALLLESQCNVNMPCGSNETALHIACENIDLDVLSLLLSHQDVDVNVVDSYNETPLDVILKHEDKASRDIRLTATKLILPRGADLSLGSSDKLHLAARSNSVELVQLLTAHGADVNIVSKTDSFKTALLAAIGCEASDNIIAVLLKNNKTLDVTYDVPRRLEKQISALHLAIVYRRPNVVRLILESGAMIDALDDQSQTPLVRALEAYEPDIAKILLAAGADPSIYSAKSYSPLMLAVGSAKADNLVPMILAKHVDLDYRLGSETALIRAVRENEPSIVKMLIDAGANIELGETPTKTALFFAIDTTIPNLEIIKLLLNAGANPDVVSQRYLYSDTDDISKMLIRARRIKNLTPTLLGLSRTKEEISIAKEFIARQSKAKLPADYYEKALHTAVEDKNIEMVSLLLLAGANANYLHDGKPLLCIAAQFDQVDIIRLLLNQGADINLTDLPFLQTALMYAAGYSNPNSAQLLLERGSNVDLKNKERSTALRVAISSGSIASAELILKFSPDINSVNPFNATVLIIAVLKGYVEFAHLILDKHPDVNVVSTLGHSALSYAVSLGDEVLISRLISMGADVMFKEKGKSLIELATTPAIKALLQIEINKVESKLLVAEIQSAYAALAGLEAGKHVSALIDIHRLELAYKKYKIGDLILGLDGATRIIRADWQSKTHAALQQMKGMVKAMGASAYGSATAVRIKRWLASIDELDVYSDMLLSILADVHGALTTWASNHSADKEFYKQMMQPLDTIHLDKMKVCSEVVYGSAMAASFFGTSASTSSPYITAAIPPLEPPTYQEVLRRDALNAASGSIVTSAESDGDVRYPSIPSTSFLAAAKYPLPKSAL